MTNELLIHTLWHIISAQLGQYRGKKYKIVLKNEKKLTFLTHMGRLPLEVTHRKSQKGHHFACPPLPYNNGQNIGAAKTTSKQVHLTQSTYTIYIYI